MNDLISALQKMQEREVMKHCEHNPIMICEVCALGRSFSTEPNTYEGKPLFAKSITPRPKYKPKNSERTNEIKKLYLSGLSLSAVGKKYGMSRQRVSQILHSIDIQGRTREAKLYTCEECKSEYFLYQGNVRRCRPCIEAKKMQWASKSNLDGCVRCGRNDRKHSGHGLCMVCFGKERYRSNPEYRKKHAVATRGWQKRHPERVKKMTKKAVKKYMQKNDPLGMYNLFLYYCKD